MTIKMKIKKSKKSPDELQKWLVLDDDDCIHVVPDFDIKPHGYPKIKKKTRLADLDCPCKPEIYFKQEKTIIIHKSFQQQERIDKSMNRLVSSTVPS